MAAKVRRDERLAKQFHTLHLRLVSSRLGFGGDIRSIVARARSPDTAMPVWPNYEPPLQL